MFTPAGTIILETSLALPVIFTEAGDVPTVKVTPEAIVLTVAALIRSLAKTLVPNTCALTTAAIVASGAALMLAASGKPAAAKAALVGANTVYFPAELTAVARFAFTTAVNNNDNSGVAVAISAIVCVGGVSILEIT